MCFSKNVSYVVLALIHQFNNRFIRHVFYGEVG